jgi:hypothetical protein
MVRKMRNYFSFWFFVFSLLGIFSSISLAYLLPVYIANPETGECRYYFAGDAKHYNEPPNGTWYIVGLIDSNRYECQELCFENTNKVWEMILKVTRSNLTLEDIPLDYRIWTKLGCSCLDEGKKGCEAWCKLNNGVLNETNWTNNVRCICPNGEWDPLYGCKTDNTTMDITQPLRKEAQTSMSILENHTILSVIILTMGFLIGFLFGRNFRIKIKIENLKANE